MAFKSFRNKSRRCTTSPAANWTQTSASIVSLESTGDDGETMPDGVYAWCTEYPGEGRVYLEPHEEDLPLLAESVIPTDIHGPIAQEKP